MNLGRKMKGCTPPTFLFIQFENSMNRVCFVIQTACKPSKIEDFRT